MLTSNACQVSLNLLLIEILPWEAAETVNITSLSGLSGFAARPELGGSRSMKSRNCSRHKLVRSLDLLLVVNWEAAEETCAQGCRTVEEKQFERLRCVTSVARDFLFSNISRILTLCCHAVEEAPGCLRGKLSPEELEGRRLAVGGLRRSRPRREDRELQAELRVWIRHASGG